MFILALLVLGLPLAFLIRALTEGPWRQVVSAEVLEARDVIYLPELNVFLVHGDPPVAFTAKSPHVGELLVYCTSSETFVSLEHGELFDRSGRYMEGPAARGMDRVPVREREGMIEIDVLQRLQGVPRGEFTRPSGPLCHAETSRLIRPGFVEYQSPSLSS